MLRLIALAVLLITAAAWAGSPRPPRPAASLELNWFDAMGTRVGPVAPLCDEKGNGPQRSIWLESVQVAATFLEGQLTDCGGWNDGVYFEDRDCSGTAFVPMKTAGFLTPAGMGAGATRYFIPTNGPRVVASFLSVGGGGSCSNTDAVSTVGDVVAALEVAREALGLPFISEDHDVLHLPLYLAPRGS